MELFFGEEHYETPRPKQAYGWLKPGREAALKRAFKTSARPNPHLKVGANKSLLKQAEDMQVLVRLSESLLVFIL
ncbi:MAG: hypothetical protein V2A74_11715 [bacterium]